MNLGSRIREQKTEAKAGSLHAVHVDRWRYTYGPASATPHHTTSTQSFELRSCTESIPIRGKYNEIVLKAETAKQGGRRCAHDANQQRYFQPSPAQDHMLHLIQTNVFRGFFDNKLALLASTKYLVINYNDVDKLQVVPPEEVFPGRAAIVACSKSLPESLHPTQLQNTTVHATCIDLLPFPAIRENLIKNDGRFSWPALLEELIGHLVSPACFVWPFVSIQPDISYKKIFCCDDSEDFTTNRHGVILWGPAHCPESWEFTPSFLRKWGWMLQGCEEIIEMSNKWRSSRGDNPITLLP